MNVFKISMLFGTEIILRYNDLFLQILEKGIYDRIECSISKSSMENLRGDFGPSFYVDTYRTSEFIFTDPRIKLNHDQSYPCLNLGEVKSRFGIVEKFNLNKSLIDDLLETGIDGEYITISTKIQIALPNHIYEVYKNYIFDVLNKSPYKIIILGEREIKKCVEYDIHGPYSIYNDLISNLKNYEDLTISDSGKNSDTEPLKKTFKILNNSKLNIYLSWAGVKSITLYCSDNIIALSEYTQNHITQRENKENIHLFQDFGAFLNKLDQYFTPNE